MENQLTTTQNSSLEINTVDLNGAFPDLNKANVMPIDIMADYWTPENSGEEKRCIFLEIKSRTVVSQGEGNEGEVLELPCAYFATQDDKGEIKTVSNGSKRLVAALENFGAQRGMPFLITYLGKKKNATNSFRSDNWSIKPLQINI